MEELLDIRGELNPECLPRNRLWLWERVQAVSQPAVHVERHGIVVDGGDSRVLDGHGMTLQLFKEAV